MNSAIQYSNPTDYAIIVGVSDYPTFSALNGPNHDAQLFYEWLTNPTNGGSVPPANCRIVQSTPSPAAPIQDQVDAKFGEIWDEVEKLPGEVKQGRRFYFYFNGHGVGINKQELGLFTGLLMANYSERFFRNAAMLAEGYRDMIVASGKFQEVVFFLDCCRSRISGVNGRSPSFSWPIEAVITGKTSKLVGYATEYRDAAYEAEYDLDPGESGSGFRGHFTEALLRGLRGGAADPISGKVTVARLKEYLVRETPRVAQEKQHIQQARITDDFLDTNAYFGMPLRTTAHYRIQIQADRHPGDVWLFNGEGDTLKQKSTDGLLWEMDLPADKYFLKDLTNGEKQMLDVKPSLNTDITEIVF